MTDYASNLAIFLQDKTGTVCGTWAGHMLAKDQRALFGRFLGKGRLCINGATEMLSHSRRVCFGTDFETTARISWRDLK